MRLTSQHPKSDSQLLVTMLLLLIAIFLVGVCGKALHFISPESFVVFQATMLIVISGAAAFYALRIQVKRFDFFHPLVFVTIYFYFPQFFLGTLQYLDPNVSLLLAPVAQITDRASAFESTLYITILGCIAMSLGFLVPWGKRLADKIPQYVVLNQPTAALKAQVTILFVFGLAGKLLNPFLDGRGRGNLTVGSANPQFTGIFDFLGYLFLFGSIVAIAAAFQKQRGWSWIIIIYVVINIFDFLTSASRGVLVNLLLLFLFAYQYAQIKLNPVRLIAIWSPIFAVGLFVGFYFGTALRNVALELSAAHGTALSIQQTIDIGIQIISETGQQNFSDIFQNTLDNANVRSTGDIVNFAAIMSHMDSHREEELQMGINNSILNNLFYTFIPRFVFPGRPDIGDNRAIGAIYFNNPNNNPGISYSIDLYRNFGLWGVFPGMFILGFILRMFYGWLIEGHTVTPTRAGLYFLVALGLKGFEAEFGTVIPGFFRIGITILVIILAIRVLTQRHQVFDSGTPS